MKKVFAVLSVLAFTLCLLSAASASDTRVGIVKGVDMKQRTIVFTPQGTSDDITLAVDNPVDLEQVAANAKVRLTVENVDGKEIVKDLKLLKAKSKRLEGC